jgi:hypothetical protein
MYMSGGGAQRSGVLVLRVWVEYNPVVTLRARITQSMGEEGEASSVTVAAGVDDVCAVVRVWLEEFAAGAPRTGS